MDIVTFIYGNSVLNEIVKKIVLGLRLYYPYNLLIMKKNREGGVTLSFIKEARDYYESNRDRIKSVLSYLADERSKETYQKLINMRQFYRKEDIPPYNYFDQYFPCDLPKFAKEWGGSDVLVDCGAFSGDITQMMAKRVPNYKHIYAFEPDDRNFDQLLKKQTRVNNLDIIKAACSDHVGELWFQMESHAGGSHILKNMEGNQAISIPCTTIDEVIGDERCDFIKMDIEGAEWDALHGAINTIKRNKPRLAISIYHSNEDMLRIPEFIHNLIPEYKLYVRAHTMGIAETILYAMI